MALLLPGLMAAAGGSGCSGPPGDRDGAEIADAPAAAPDVAPPVASTVDLETTRADPPALPGSLAPHLSAAPGGDTWASWIEVETPAASEEGPRGAPLPTLHRLRVARYDGTTWSRPVTVATATPDRPFFANWADVPSVTEGEGGELLAHWLAKTGDDVYAYGVFLARSTDGGATWRPLGALHDDDTPTEHGFVSILPRPGGGFRAFWLDGRAMAGGGPMALRTATVVDGAVAPATGGAGEVLDDRVCECCRTSATEVAGRPLVVYRDRSPGEVRDIFAIHALEGGGWSAPASVHGDGWQIAGCPVNGPAVAARDGRAVVAWFTAAGGTPRVRAAFSEDGGATFGAVGELAGGAEAPLGRVDAALLADGTAVVAWLSADGAVRLRRLAPDGTSGPPRQVARTSPERAGGFPRLQVAAGDGGEHLRLVWTDPDAGGGSRIRFATLPVARLEGPRGVPSATGASAAATP